MAEPRPSPFALGLALLALRVALGVLFVWAGAVKWVGTMPVQGEDAAILAGMGLVDRPGTGVPGAVTPSPTVPPAKPLPSPGPPPTPNTPAKPTAGVGTAVILFAQTSPPAAVTSAAPVFTAADFPEPVQCRIVWHVALGVHHAAHPAAGKMALWPRMMGEGVWPRCLAVAVLVCEFGGGMFVLVGLFTRLSALSLAGVMLGAMWLTQIGPAMQAGNATLGFLPPHEWKDGAAWQTLIVQGLALSSAIALVCLGSGTLALDRALAGYRSSGPSKPTPSGAATGGGAGGR